MTRLEFSWRQYASPVSYTHLGIERLQADAAMAPAAQTTLAALHASTLWMQQTVSTLLALSREGESAAGKTHEPVAVLPLLEQWVLCLLYTSRCV